MADTKSSATDLPESPSSVAVLGAGHQGHTFAGYLGLNGVDVSVVNRSHSKVNRIRDNGGIKVTGEFSGFVELEPDEVTTDVAAGIEGRDVILVAVPGYGHEYFARELSCKRYCSTGGLARRLALKIVEAISQVGAPMNPSDPESATPTIVRQFVPNIVDMHAEARIPEYYRALEAGDPLGPFFADGDAVVKFGISERLVGGREVRRGLAGQTERTDDWDVDSRALRVIDRGCHAWFSDDVRLSWRDVEAGVEHRFETRWSGTLEARDGVGVFVGMHVSTANPF